MSGDYPVPPLLRQSQLQQLAQGHDQISATARRETPQPLWATCASVLSH